MRTNKVLIVFITIFLVLIVGCSNGIKSDATKNEENKAVKDGNEIVIEKFVGGADIYEQYNEVKDIETVKKLKDILNNISLENANVSMSHPPKYKFHLENSGKESKASNMIYE